MDKGELIEFINSNSELDIYYAYLLGQEVWYFEKSGTDASKQYDNFKKFIARKLNIPFNNLAIVGSAKTRFSFSPIKVLSEFHETSDFDLIIVSDKLFRQIWQAFREVSLNQHLHGYSYKCSNVFNGFVSFKDDDPTYGHVTLQSWQRTINSFKAELQLTFNIEHDINYRIYSDWESVQDYHVKGISKLKISINETN